MFAIMQSFFEVVGSAECIDGKSYQTLVIAREICKLQCNVKAILCI